MRLYLFFPTLLALFCAAFSPANAQSRSATDCPEINVKVEIIHTRDGRANGEVVLKFDDAGKADEYIILLICPGCTNIKKAVDLAFRDLEKGHYDIYIVDKTGCSKQLNIQVN